MYRCQSVRVLVLASKGLRSCFGMGVGLVLNKSLTLVLGQLVRVLVLSVKGLGLGFDG